MHGSMDVFGPWLQGLFGMGAVLLAGGLLTKGLAGSLFLQRLGRTAVNVGWRLVLLAIAAYALIVALQAAFENMVSNLPGA